MFPYATRERAAANESWQLIWGFEIFSSVFKVLNDRLAFHFHVEGEEER